MRLKNGRNSVIVTRLGGSVMQWRVGEHFVLGPTRDVPVGKNKVARRGESHWCYPNYGTPPPAWSGFGKHGFLRRLLHKVDYNANGSVRFHREDSQRETGIHVDVGTAGLQVTLTVRNLATIRVPILPAFHPYFAVPKRGARVVGGGRTLASVSKKKVVGVSSKARTLEYAGPITIHLDGVGSVEMGASCDASHVVIWSDQPESCVCVEPVFGRPGSFGTPEGRWLEPGEHMMCYVVLSFEPNK